MEEICEQVQMRNPEGNFSEAAECIDKKKGDIVQQIKDFYMGRGKVQVNEPEGLVPTKAALFGLDIRFREVDRRILDEKMRRSAFKAGAKASGVKNRHEYPQGHMVRKAYTSAQATRAKKNFTEPIAFAAGTCYDDVISKEWNVGVPKSRSYLAEKDFE